jgi:3-oxoacyl-[acyl-carrier protein] reductase
VVARDQAGIDKLVNTLANSGATAIGVSMEGADYASVERCREKVEAELGPTDILMIFVGGFGLMTPVTEITEEEWREVVDSNLTSTFFACKSFLPGMIERGRGSIVTMASNAARNLDVTLTASYAAAKAGIVQFTRHVARRSAPAACASIAPHPPRH